MEQTMNLFSVLWHQADRFLVWLNTVLTPAGCLLTLGFMVCVLMIIRTVRRYKMALEVSRMIPDTTMDAPFHDLQALAGDDVVTAQLDLVRAYLEMGSHDKATALLDAIGDRGTPDQRQDALRLRADVHR